MRRLGFVLLLLFPLTAHAWTPASEERIARKSAALAPPDLRLLLDRFEGDYKEGLRRAQSEEGTGHRYLFASRQGALRQRIERETTGAIAAIRKGEPMADVVARLGVIVHLVGDANNPFHVANHDARLASSQADFERYFERRLLKFPTVFYGLDRRFRLGPYLDATLARSARFYPLLGEEYFRSGSRRTSESFDDRSTAFGVASISYSRAVSDVVNIYYYIWKEAGGDVRSAAAMRDGNIILHAH